MIFYIFHKILHWLMTVLKGLYGKFLSFALCEEARENAMYFKKQST